MFKLLRKYDKWILAIGGSLLMVVFLLPQALQQFGANPQKMTAATFEGGKISEGDMMEARREIGILDALSPQIAISMLQLGSSTDSDTADIGPAMHWLFLTREAEAQGLIGGAQDGRAFIPVAAKFFARQYLLANRFSLDMNTLPDLDAQLTQNYIGQFEAMRTAFINRSGIPPVMVDRTLAKARGVLRMYEAYLAFNLPALQESMLLCHEYFDSAEVLFMTVGSDAFIDQAYEPDENEILIHYSDNKDSLPGQGEFGFGYRAEDRVRLEWLRITRQEISDAVVIDPIEANTRWRGDRTTYPGEFSEERSNVERDLRSERTDSILREAEQLVRAELLKARGGLEQGANGFYDLPEDWASSRPRFIDIAQSVGERLRSKYGEDMPNPSALDDSAQWRTLNEVRGIPIVGSASKLIGPTNVPLADLAFSTPEIDPESNYPVQTGIAQGPLTAARIGDIVFFRVTEAEASAPLPLDQVRAEVIEDIRRLNAFESLKDEAPRIVRDVIANGVTATAESRGLNLYQGVRVKRDRIEPIDPVTSPPTHELQKINTEDFRNAVMDRVETFAVNEPLNRLDPDNLLLSIPLNSRREVAITGINNVIPLTSDAFRMIESEALQYNRTREFNIEALQSWPFSPESIRARYDVNIIRQTDDLDEELEGGAAEADPEPSVADASDAGN